MVLDIHKAKMFQVNNALIELQFCCDFEVPARGKGCAMQHGDIQKRLEGDFACSHMMSISKVLVLFGEK